jgi:hypothetical protein
MTITTLDEKKSENIRKKVIFLQDFVIRAVSDLSHIHNSEPPRRYAVG